MHEHFRHLSAQAARPAFVSLVSSHRPSSPLCISIDRQSIPSQLVPCKDTSAGSRHSFRVQDCFSGHRHTNQTPFLPMFTRCLQLQVVSSTEEPEAAMPAVEIHSSIDLPSSTLCRRTEPKFTRCMPHSLRSARAHGRLRSHHPPDSAHGMSSVYGVPKRRESAPDRLAGAS